MKHLWTLAQGFCYGAVLLPLSMWEGLAVLLLLSYKTPVYLSPSFSALAKASCLQPTNSRPLLFQLCGTLGVAPHTSFFSRHKYSIEVKEGIWS